MTTTHELKCHADCYSLVASGLKRFELRKNDRGFRVGDILRLRELADAYTGRECSVRVTHMLERFDGLQEGYVIMSVEVLR